MAEPGSVSWQFVQKGYLAVPANQKSYDDLFMVAAEAGADDVIDDSDTIEIYTPRDQLQSVEEALRTNGVGIEEAKLEWVAKTPIELAPDDAVKVVSAIEQIEDLDDVQSVHSNLNVTDEVANLLEVAAG